jgi:chorismate synthase
MLMYLTAGESHGSQLTAIVDGLPAGLPVDADELNRQLARRQSGYGRGARMKIEKDRAQIVSGVRSGITLGGPVALVIPNLDWPAWADIMNPAPGSATTAGAVTLPRPGHADLAGGIKWCHHDLRNVSERASARETAARVAVGALARQFLEQFGVEFASHVIQIGSVRLDKLPDIPDLRSFLKAADRSDVRCIDKATSKRMKDEIRKAKQQRDSLGGMAEVIVRGLPVGLGSCSQWNRRLDGLLAGALMAIPSVKGVEIGPAFENAGRCGFEVHDVILYESGSRKAGRKFSRKTNRAGGVEGGMTNGEDIVLRVAGKPIATLGRPLMSVDVVTKKPGRAPVVRADICIIPALGVISEAVAALVLADSFMAKFGSDSLVEIRRNYQAYLDSEY